MLAHNLTGMAEAADSYLRTPTLQLVTLNLPRVGLSWLNEIDFSSSMKKWLEIEFNCKNNTFQPLNDLGI